MPKRKKSQRSYRAIEEESSSENPFDQPVQRNAANARERARMRVLSCAFYKLKTTIPWVPQDTKLSKLDTLRLASNYINYLVSTLEGNVSNDAKCAVAYSQKLTWPYIFQERIQSNNQSLNQNKDSSDCFLDTDESTQF